MSESDRQPIRLTTPLTRDVTRILKSGDSVLITGRILAARDAAHKRLVETLERGEPLPPALMDAGGLENQIIYYVGPSPAKPDQPIGSAGPTTGGRMDPYTPALLELGLTGIIAKGGRSPQVLEAMRHHEAVYFAATGGAGALLARQIKRYTVLAYPELGPEALAELWVEDFPVIVINDCHGGNLYEEGMREYARP